MRDEDMKWVGDPQPHIKTVRDEQTHDDQLCADLVRIAERDALLARVVKAEGELIEVRLALSQTEFLLKWTRQLFENSPGSPSVPMMDLLEAVHRYFDSKGDSHAKPS